MEICRRRFLKVRGRRTPHPKPLRLTPHLRISNLPQRGVGVGRIGCGRRKMADCPGAGGANAGPVNIQRKDPAPPEGGAKEQSANAT